MFPTNIIEWGKNFFKTVIIDINKCAPAKVWGESKSADTAETSTSRVVGDSRQTFRSLQQSRLVKQEESPSASTVSTNKDTTDSRVSSSSETSRPASSSASRRGFKCPGPQAQRVFIDG